MRVDQKIEVDVPIRHVYNQWTQFEEYPRFMEGVVQVQQLDDTRLHWVAEIGGERKEWYAKIKRQVPDEVISWESEGGAGNSGTVIFKPIEGDRTQIEIHMNFEPEGMKETIGGALQVPDQRVAGDLKRFKEFIEQRGVETGGWRGEIRHGAEDDPSSQMKRTGYDR